MGLPPHAFGRRAPAVRLEKVGELRWRVRVDEHSLAQTFLTEGEAWSAAAAEVVRLDAVGIALLRRIRTSLDRKRH